jgi:membrane associated rhomboid family serine protease
MIPIRDTQQSSRIPVITYALIILNLLVFIFQFQVGFNNEGFLYTFGLVPAKYTVHELAKYFSFSNQVMSVFSYMFLHGGFMHFIGNMWSLYIFGDNVEEYFGHLRFLGFYILCGIISGLVHFFSNPISPIPTIGASGAIAGVMGAYFILFPRSKVLTFIPIFIIPWFIKIPAVIFLGLWFFMQVLNATGSSAAGSGIAWWAHIGGFIAGILLVRLNKKKLPAKGKESLFSRSTVRKHTPKLQMIVPSDSPDSPDRFGTLDITTMESITGTLKMVTIPWGFYKPLYKIKVPPGVTQGTSLKLTGMGRTMPDGLKGNLYLTINIKNPV